MQSKNNFNLKQREPGHYRQRNKASQDKNRTESLHQNQHEVILNDNLQQQYQIFHEPVNDQQSIPCINSKPI